MLLSPNGFSIMAFWYHHCENRVYLYLNRNSIVAKNLHLQVHFITSKNGPSNCTEFGWISFHS